GRLVDPPEACPNDSSRCVARFRADGPRDRLRSRGPTPAGYGCYWRHRQLHLSHFGLVADPLRMVRKAEGARSRTHSPINHGPRNMKTMAQLLMLAGVLCAGLITGMA